MEMYYIKDFGKAVACKDGFDCLDILTKNYRGKHVAVHTANKETIKYWYVSVLNNGHVVLTYGDNKPFIPDDLTADILKSMDLSMTEKVVR